MENKRIWSALQNAIYGFVQDGTGNAIIEAVAGSGKTSTIEEAFKREAEIDARHISVAISDHTARLYGHVHSLNEANAARAAAASAPGIASVESHLVVTP